MRERRGDLSALWLMVCLAELLFCGGHCGAQAGRPAAEQRQVVFRYAPQSAAHTVSVAGTFNGWNKGANRLRLLPDGRTWQLTLAFAPGVYQYKFVVDDTTWIPDPNAPQVDDGNGNINSQLALTPSDYDLRPGKPGDGIITTSALQHLPDRDHVVRRDATHFAFLLRTRHDDVQACTLLCQAQGRRTLSAPMARAASDPIYDTWRGIATVPVSGAVRYAFLIRDGGRMLLYSAPDRSAPAPPSLTHSTAPWSASFQLDPGSFHLDPAQYPTLHVPDWPHDAVFYQIFPDRFANGDPTNDGTDADGNPAQPWGTQPTYFNRMGGDLEGVRQHLDYLRALGINALYFNPIFASRSNHGYDTTDYLQVDPRFGTNGLLAALTADCHALGWHVILDGVFNHTGVDAPWFKSLREEGERSPYRDWYFVKGFPLEVKDGQQNYVGWFGSPWLPKLNVANPSTRKYLLSVATTWIHQAKIDGWRLDAADEVSHDYWVDFRRAVRVANPNAYIVGEIWGDAHTWLKGDQFDSVMNYRWRGATLDFFAGDKLSPTQFDRALARIRDDYPDDATAEMFNILDSHDTERVRNTCKGDWARERQAVVFQMTYPGTPCIYYGDEVGMAGGRDPDDRRCMIWDRSQWNAEVLDFYKRLLATRRAHSVLRRGDYRTALADDQTGCYAFTRAFGNARALILFNRSDAPRQVVLPFSTVGDKLPQDWLPCGATLKQDGDRLLISLPPRGIALFGVS